MLSPLSLAFEQNEAYLIYVKDGSDYYCKDGRHELQECISFLVDSGKESLVMVAYNSAYTPALIKLQSAAESAGIKDISLANENDLAK